MNGFENQAGINISGSKIQIVEVNFKNNRYFLENIDEAYFIEPLNFEKDKETKISALLQGAFNELLINKPLNTSNISFTLPPELFYSMQVPYDYTLLHQDLIEEFKWELSVLFPHSVTGDDFALQYLEIEKNHILTQNSTIVFAVKRKYIRLLEKFSKENNLKLRFVDNPHIASDKALSMSQPVTEFGLTLSMYFSGNHFSLALSLKGKPFYFKSFPATNVSNIPGLIENELETKEHFKMNKVLLDAAYISGDEISDSLITSLKKVLDMDLEYFNPFDKIKAKEDLYKNNYFTEKFSSFTSAAGVAYRLS